MGTLLANWNKVKVLACLELIFTVTTVSIIGHAYISNKELLGEIELKNAEYEEPENQPEPPNIDESIYRKYFGRGLLFVGASGMVGIFMCVVLILTGKFENFSGKGKSRILGCWFVLNVVNVVIMTFLWGGLIFFVAMDHVRVSTGADTQIPYGICYVCRIVLVFVIRKMRQSVLAEREYTDEMEEEEK